MRTVPGGYCGYIPVVFLSVVLLYGWWASGVGDASYGRLETIPFPDGGITWLYIVPPILLIILTKYGIPVSTTFLSSPFFRQAVWVPC